MGAHSWSSLLYGLTTHTAARHNVDTPPSTAQCRPDRRNTSLSVVLSRQNSECCLICTYIYPHIVTRSVRYWRAAALGPKPNIVTQPVFVCCSPGRVFALCRLVCSIFTGCTERTVPSTPQPGKTNAAISKCLLQLRTII